MARSLTYDFSFVYLTSLHSILIDLHVHKENTPGLLMTEKMVGNVTINSTGEHSYCDFVLDFKSDNITSMIELDPEHTSSINGTVTCPGLSKDPIAATGTFHK